MGRSCTPNPCQQRHAGAIRCMDEQNCGTCREWTILGSIPKVPTATSPCQFFNNFFLLIDLLHQRVRCSSPQSQDGRLGGFNGFFNPDRRHMIRISVSGAKWLSTSEMLSTSTTSRGVTAASDVCSVLGFGCCLSHFAFPIYFWYSQSPFPTPSRQNDFYKIEGDLVP